MTVIWGFDLSQMSWSAFGHKKMFDRRWYLRRERFIFYQLAMLIGLAAECTATYSLSKYEDLQKHVEAASLDPNFSSSALPGRKASLKNDDIIDAAITTIVFCVLVATIFGADFFFLVFWPRRSYPGWYSKTKKVVAVITTLGVGVAAIVSTIVISTHRAFITNVDMQTAQGLVNVYFRPPLVYRHFPQNIAWVVLLWLTFPFTIISTILVFIADTHDRKFGPTPESVLNEKEDTDLFANTSSSRV